MRPSRVLDRYAEWQTREEASISEILKTGDLKPLSGYMRRNKITWMSDDVHVEFETSKRQRHNEFKKVKAQIGLLKLAIHAPKPPKGIPVKMTKLSWRQGSLLAMLKDDYLTKPIMIHYFLNKDWSGKDTFYRTYRNRRCNSWDLYKAPEDIALSLRILDNSRLITM